MPLSGTQTSRERASGNAERHRWPGMRATGERSRRTAPPRAAAFWLVAGVLCLLFFAAGAVGSGLTLLGVNRTLIALAPPGQRARLIAAIFIISFLGLSIPALIAGVATAHFGLHRTALAYCVATAALAAAAAGSLMLRRHGPGHRPRALATSALRRDRAG